MVPFTCRRCGHLNEEAGESDFGRVCARCFVDADVGRVTFSGHLQRVCFAVMYLVVGYMTIILFAVGFMIGFDLDEGGRSLLLYAVHPPALALTVWLWRRRGRSQFLAPKPPASGG